MKKINLLFSLLTLSSLSFAQIQSQPLSSATDPSAGISYSLPKTIVEVKVETRCIQETPGVYSPYAERYLGLTNVCKTENTRYEIIGVHITTKAIPDLQNSYLITSGKEKNTTTVALTAEGFLKSINGNSNCINNVLEKKRSVVRPKTDNYQTDETSIVTQEMQQSNSTAKMAELASAKLFNLRDSRFNLLTQDLDKTPSDGRSYEIVLSELNRMEKYYLELFTGKRIEKTETTKFEYDPEKNGEDILFRFSQLKGVVEKSNLGGSPVFITLQKTIGTRADIAKSVGTKNKKGFALYYRIPGEAQIKITDESATLYDQEITVAQFGRVMTLPLGSVKYAEICPKTGAILKLGK